MKRSRRRKDRPRRTGVAVGVAWYSRASWEQLQRIASDPELLEPTYEEWVEMAEGALSKVRAACLFPEKVELDIGRLTEWCRKKKRPIDAAARAEFTAQSLRVKNENPDRSDAV
jgi:hypothetical protein